MCSDFAMKETGEHKDQEEAIIPFPDMRLIPPIPGLERIQGVINLQEQLQAIDSHEQDEG